MKKLLILLLSAVSVVNLYGQSIDDALKAIDAEQYDKAKGMLEQLVKSNPDNGEYNFHLGTLYLIMGEDALAKETFRKGESAKKGGHFNYIGLGQIALNDGNTENAVAEFNKVTAKLGKKDTKELLYIAKAYLNSFNPDYAKAVEYAKRVVGINSSFAQAYLTLGDAELKLKRLNEASSAYNNAYALDKNLLRARLHEAVIIKSTHNFADAILQIDGIIEDNSSYGPAYRELAEIYYLWAILDKRVYDEYIKKALTFYEKYMSLTDYSLNSRMRHADFLVLAKDYEALQKEAEEMQKIDKVNPRIFRYLGYAAVENGNYQEGIDALEKFLTVVEPYRILGMDYAYLARAEAKMILASEAAVDTAKLSRMNNLVRIATAKDTPLDEDFGDVGRKLYKAQEYGLAATVFDALISGSKGSLTDQFYLANSILYNAVRMDSTTRTTYQEELMRADSAYALVIEGSPTTQDTYFSRARLNRYVIGPDAEANMAKYYGEYIKVLEEKGEAEIAKSTNKNKLAEAYASIGMFYSESEPDTALTYIGKALEYNPANEQATLLLNYLKSNKK